MIKYIFNIIPHTLGSLYLLGCLFSCDYLDVIPDNIATIDDAFVDQYHAENYLSTCYWYLPYHAHVTYDPAMLGGGEFNSYQGGLGRHNYTPIIGTFSSTNISGNYWDGFSDDTRMFRAIRDCNIFLENIHKPYDLLEVVRRRYVAEAKFLKAYYHFYLLRLYGPIPIIDTNKDVSESIEELRVYREPFDECVEYISNLLDEAIVDLPQEIYKEGTELGRITKPIALAVKAKLWMTAASPLFNGNTDYVNFIDNRGKQLFNTTYAPEKWEKAAEACKEAIDAAHEVGNQLYIPVETPYELANYDRLRHQFCLRQIIWDKWNSEMIWGTRKTDLWTLQSYCMPKLEFAWRTSGNIKSWLNPTLDLVESYYSKNGVPISEDLDYDYEGRYLTSIAGEEEAWYIQDKYETARLHFNREPRFYANIGFDGGIWWGTGRTNPSDQQLYVTECRFNQAGGLQTWEYFSITSYYSKKLVHYQTEGPESSGGDPSIYTDGGNGTFPVIRLADLYLLYAEALNECKSAPDASVYEYIDKVRERAGLEGVVHSWNKYSQYPDKPTTKEGMRAIIQQERMIELAMEGHWMYDIRRWKRGIEFWNKDWKSWNIYGEDPDEFYTFLSTGEELKFFTKHYLWPITQNNLYTNPNLVQNPGY